MSSNVQDDYRDIVATHRGISYITWALQSWQPSHLYSNGSIAPQHCDRDELFNHILDLPRFRHLSQDEQERVRRLLDEIGHDQRLSWIRLTGMVLGKLMGRIYASVIVHRESIERVRLIVPLAPMILLPTHRSYVDFLITPYLFFYYHLPLPLIAAGEDFKHMKGIGTLLRLCCAFYLRRSFNGPGDELYKKAFESYLQQLVLDGSHPIEFFIEGTRSRTGKSLRPKFGLFKMILDLYFKRRVHDLMLVPMGICYERTLEETLHARELLGIPKPKESTSGFVRGIRSFSETYGGMIVKYGEPMSVHEFFRSMERTSENSDHRSCRGWIDEFGTRIVVAQQSLLPIPAFSIVCAVAKPDMTLDKLHHKAIALARVVATIRDASPSLSLLRNASDVNQAIRQHPNIMEIDSDGRIQFISYPVHLTFEEAALDAIQRQHYTNQFLVFIFLPVIAYLSHHPSITSSSQRLSGSSPREIFQLLVAIFSHEFVTEASCPTWAESAFDKTMEKIRRLEIFQQSAYQSKDGVSLDALLKLFHPFFYAYTTVLGFIKPMIPSPGPISEDGLAFQQADILQKYREKLTTAWSNREFACPEICSKELPGNCLKSLSTTCQLLTLESGCQFSFNGKEPRKTLHTFNLIDDLMNQCCILTKGCSDDSVLTQLHTNNNSLLVKAKL